MKSKARLRTLAPRMKNDTCANSWTAKEEKKSNCCVSQDNSNENSYWD